MARQKQAGKGKKALLGCGDAGPVLIILCIKWLSAIISRRGRVVLLDIGIQC